MRRALLGLRQPQRVLRVGSPSVFVDKPSGTHLTSHPGRLGGGVAASSGSEGHIITLPPLSVVADRHVKKGASAARIITCRQCGFMGKPQHQHPAERRRNVACNREHVSAGEKGEDTEGQTQLTHTLTHARWEHTPTERDVGRVTSLARPRPPRRFQPAREQKMGAEPICSGFSNKEQSGMMKCACMLA